MAEAQQIEDLGQACAESQSQDLGWALATVLRTYSKAAGAAVADVPGGPRGYQVLTIAAAGTCRNQAGLADQLGMDRTMMTYLIDDLERHGLVERRPDPSDRRSRQVLLTAAGTEALAKARESVARVEEHVLGGLSPADAATLRELLARVAAMVGDGGFTNACSVAEKLQT